MSYKNNYYKSSTEFAWIDNSYVKVEQKNKRLTSITANKEGLLSLAHQLELLALGSELSCCYEPWPGDLEEGSVTLEVIKIDCSGRQILESEVISMSTEDGQ